MNKRSIRTFALGILFSVSLIGTGYFFLEKGETKGSPIQEAIKTLEKSGYIILTEKEYKKLESQKTKAPLNSNNEQINQPEAKYKTGNEFIKKKFVIKSGMTSSQVSSQLRKERIIENAEDFEQYLIDGGYSTSLRAGTFELTNKMSFREIARIITKK